jgi:hypothetical protein
MPLRVSMSSVATEKALSVSAAGGWLMGSCLSFSSSEYGLGVDQVVTFDLVLTNGTMVQVDGCTNPELFWALHGGGGGTFGAGYKCQVHAASSNSAYRRRFQNVGD